LFLTREVGFFVQTFAKTHLRINEWVCCSIPYIYIYI